VKTGAASILIRALVATIVAVSDVCDATTSRCLKNDLRDEHSSAFALLFLRYPTMRQQTRLAGERQLVVKNGHLAASTVRPDA
jgi:hypothetical protein